MKDVLGDEERPTAGGKHSITSSGFASDAMEELRVDLLPIEDVPLNALRPGDSPRLSGRSTEHVDRLAATGWPLPPIIVHSPSMRIIDGIHRVEAAALRGDREIRARLFDGDADVAFRLAVHVNVTHGLPLTLADRTTAAGRILRAQPILSDRTVAYTTALSPGTVRAIRQRLSLDMAGVTGRRGRDGRVRPVNGANGRRLAAVLLSDRPGASLREIAREAGISPATVRDVRERVRRGDNPVPTRLQSSECATDRPVRQVNTSTPAIPRPDPAQLVHSLRNDPSLRFSETGRMLIAWLNEHVVGVGRWSDLLPQVPPHSTYLLADIARGCAAEWARFADELCRHRGTEHAAAAGVTVQPMPGDRGYTG